MKTPPRERGSADQRRAGLTLFVVIVALAAMGILGLTVLALAKLDATIAGQYKKGTEALYQADAGVQYVFNRVKADVASASIILDAAVEPVSYSAPAGFAFDPVTTLTRLPDGRSYLFEITGHSADSRARIEVTLSNEDPLPMRLFGNRNISMGPSTVIYSYSSSVVQTPVPADSTDAATAGSNENMGGGATDVHGTVYLGQDTLGNPAWFCCEGNPAADVVRRDRIDPDPLGAVGGGLATKFAQLATVNDNANAVGGTRVGNVLTIHGDVTLIAGDYYVDEIDLANGDILTIDASAGRVNIYLTGGVTTGTHAETQVTPNIPSNLRIFSNSADPIEFKPKTDFTAFIYAPYSTITLKPNSDCRGSFWGDRLSIAPGNGFFADTDNMFDPWEALIGIASWKQVAQ